MAKKPPASKPPADTPLSAEVQRECRECCADLDQLDRDLIQYERAGFDQTGPKEILLKLRPWLAKVKEVLCGR